MHSGRAPTDVTSGVLTSARRSGLIQIFVYLQLLDLLTTLLGLRLGATEGSPFVRLLMHPSPLAGLISSKLVALSLAAISLRLGKRHLLRLASYWYAALVVWNLLMILATLGGVRT